MATEASAGREAPATVTLLEREDELERLSALFERVHAGRGGLVVVEGRPGVGKSALLEHGEHMALGLGMAVLRARGHELERSLAWGVVRTLLEARVAGDDGLLAGPAAPAAVVFDPGRGGELPRSSDLAFAIAHALYRLVARLAEQRPVLLAVDDAHWADEPSLRFLVYLAARLAEQPVAVLVAARSGDRGHGGLLDVLAGEPAATALELAPLTAGAVATLVRRRHGTADGAFCRRCHELTGGNPLELQGLLAAVEPGAPDPAALESAAALAAGRLARSVLRRLDAVPPDAQALARAVAVIEHDADPGLAAALAHVDTDAMLSAVDDLESAHILRPGGTLAFAHPLLRAAVYETLRYSDRVKHHRRAAELLASRGASSERVGAHLLECPPAGDAAVVDVLWAAARRAREQGAPAAAARYLARALREPPAEDRYATVLAELGRAEALAGYPDAPARLEAAIDRSADPRERAQLQLDLGRALSNARRLEESREAFRRGLNELGEDGSELALDLDAGHLTTTMHVPELAGEVRRRVEGVLWSDAALTTRARRGLASKAMIVRLFAAAPHAETLAVARLIFGDGRLIADDRFDSQVLSHVISTLGWCDDYDTAEDALAMTLAEAERSGSSLAFAMACSLRARQRLWTGPATDAVADARAAVEVLRAGALMYVPPATWCLVRALLERSAPSEAAAALELTKPARSQSAWRHAARGSVAAASGDDEAALAAFLACGRRLEGLLVVNPAVLPWRSEAGLAAARLGGRRQARDLVAEELALAERFRAPRALAVAQRADGLLAGDAGVERLRGAADALGSCGARLEQARTLVDLGGAVRRAGRPREAREILHEALRLAEQTGAAAQADLAAGELKLAGGRAPAAGGRARDALTPSERRVAELAASGQSNRQIADGLFLTVKSIEWHLGNVYRKLGITGRAALGQALEGADRPGG